MSSRRPGWNNHSLWGLLLGCAFFLAWPISASGVNPAQTPLFLGNNGTPLSLLVMGRDHKLYYEAYNDASDLNQDGTLDVGYKPDSINYYGYFDSNKCYSEDGTKFNPISVTTNKKCSGSWSGDFLNYLTMSRMDALRRVFIGGYRSTDTATETVLERVRVPQDAHSWGKEYTSTLKDGYNISNYAPLPQPQPNTRHLFANTTLSTTGDPLLRVLTNSRFRIWNWLSIERPVAGDECVSGSTGTSQARVSCVEAASTLWEIVPASAFRNLTQTTYNTAAQANSGVPAAYGTHPGNNTQYNQLVANYARADRRFGSGPVATINGSGNPFSSQQDDYLTIFQGEIVVPTTGTYTFSVDGDDAVELIINNTVVAAWYGGHGSCNCNTRSGTITLTANTPVPIVFRHQERFGGDNYFLRWERVTSASDLEDYPVRVAACVSTTANPTGLLEPECKQYRNPTTSAVVYKPTGLLHDYGETDKMAFGLLTGSYKKHLSGGILRKNISSFKNEVNPDTGQFIIPTTDGSIANTINRLAVTGFNYSSYSYTDGGCGVPMVTAMQEGRCAMWGNPVAEMMYEGLRYFAGKSGPTSAYDFTNAGTADATLGLPKPAWKNPYRDPVPSGTNTDPGYVSCSRPFEVVIADANSFDTDQIPGSAFLSDVNNPAGTSGSLNDTLNVGVIDLAAMYSAENEGSTVFIGQSGSTYDFAPTPKTASSFGSIRGLAPEEPTRQGGFYAAAVAQYGKTNDLNPVTGNQKTDTFSVALSSPLPRIEIPVKLQGGGERTVTLVPFAKTVGGCTSGTYRPTNTIVDFYVDTIANTSTLNRDNTINSGRAYGKFSINFEDSEYGSDHDMDAIVTYEVFDDGNGQLRVNLTSDYAAGGCIQHMGYVVSGTTADGVYLEVRDTDTGAGSDVDYALDTPPGSLPSPGNTRRTSAPFLDLTASRTFTPGTASAQYIKHDPLWYAAKWGGFNDKDKNNQLTNASEWDEDGNGTPDSYFLVTNAGDLKTQLQRTFNEVINRTGSSAAVAVNTGSLNVGSQIYQALFTPGVWSGELRAFNVNSDGSLESSPAWEASQKLDDLASADAREIITYKPTQREGIPFRWPSNPSSPGISELDTAQIAALKGTDDDIAGENRLKYLRGDDDNEGAGPGQFRVRPTVLGDIVNSNPIYVAAPTFRYPENAVFGGYAAFRSANVNRKPVVYVGANDGMLHGFDTTVVVTNGTATPGPDAGKEIIAYVPDSVFNNLIELTKPNYSHLYFVDAQPTAGDVKFTSPNEWRTVLVSGLRGGGRGLFALDITDPNDFDESNAADLVLWERKNQNYGSVIGDFSQLGFTFGQPSIVKMHDGSWAAVFGNGYDAGSRTAVLFIVNVETGELIKKIDTGLPADPNGLSTPAAIDVNGDFIADFIYAGDLQGNLWRFDVTSPNEANWDCTRPITACVPLFTASSTSTGTPPVVTPQPITTKPEVVRHPLSPASGQPQGVIVLFGTGKYIETTDVTNTSQQTFYGIWDDHGGATVLKSELVQQTFDPTSVSLGTQTFRVSSANEVNFSATPPKKGWFLNMPNQGERIVGDPLVVGSRVVFTSILPSDDPCAFGGRSWLNVLDAVTGKRADETFLTPGGTTPLKVANPSVTGQDVAPTSREMNGIASAASVMNSTNLQTAEQINLYASTSEGTIEFAPLSTMGELGRQSWRQLELQ